MRPTVTPIEVPGDSAISRHLEGAHFHDCYETSIESAAPTALHIYLGVVAQTPSWVNGLMAVRNRAASIFDLKNLGPLGAVAPAKPASAYRVGDRVGIFSLLELTDNEVILGDHDKHLQVRLSVFKRSCGGRHSVAVSTVVHVHNMLGHVYMGFVAPVHKRIVPALLARAALGLRGA